MAPGFRKTRVLSFNPYPSPYDAFINYMNVLADFMSRVEEKCGADILDKINKAADEMTETARKKVDDFSEKVKEEASKAKEKATGKAKETWDDVKDYSLDDIAKMSNAGVKKLLKKIDTDELAHVLKDAGDEVRNKIIPNMTKTAQTQFEKLEKEIRKVKKSDIKKYSDKIENELRKFWKKK